VKKKNILKLLIIFFTFTLLALAESVKLPKFENPVPGGHIIRYSNVVVYVAGKKIAVPIYGGFYESILYEDLEKQQKYKNNYLLGGVTIFTKQGDVGKTFHNILKFYKKSFFKDIDMNKPSVIGNEGSSWYLIWYDFEYEGLPCSMMISVECDEKASIKKIEKMGYGRKQAIPVNGTIDMLSFNEKSPGIGLSIYIGESSSFKKN